MSKFLFITANDVVPWGGSEVLWCQTATRLLEAGHTVAASVPDWNPMPEPHRVLAQKGARLFRRPRKPPSLISRGMRRLFPRRQGITPAALQLAGVADFTPDLCVVSDGSNVSAVEWLEVLHGRGWPAVTIFQAVNIQQWPDDSLRQRLIPAYSRARRNYFVSQSNLDDTALQLGLALNHAEVVRNPFTVPFEAAPPWNRQLTPLRLACVGRLHPPAKGQDLLFEVLALPHWRPRVVTVTLCGTGPQVEALQSLAGWRGLSNVRFAGHVDDIPGIWAGHHALVLPSRYEGLPLVVVEAMLCNRCCIVTRAGGNAELIRDNDTGFIAAAPTVELLDEAMNRAWQRRDELEAIGRRAGEAVRSLVPRDPVGVFADKLLGQISGG